MNDDFKKLFTQHPNAIGETYLEHFFYAFCLGLRCWVIGTIAMIHAILPFTFTHTAHDQIQKLAKELTDRIKKVG